MDAIVIGQFSAVKQAARAVEKLRKSCVSDDRVRAVVLKSPQDAVQPAPAPVPNMMGDAEKRRPDRPAGILVAVETPNCVSRSLARCVLCEYGAHIVENDPAWPSEEEWLDADPASLTLLDRFIAEKEQGPGFVPIRIERPY